MKFILSFIIVNMHMEIIQEEDYLIYTRFADKRIY